MGKNLLQGVQTMSVAAAEAMARSLVQRESRGPGDLENAMRRIETKYGVPYSTLWSLRYRAPKDILVGVFLSLRAAYEAECARQMANLEHELELSKAAHHEIDPDLAAEIEALARKIKAQKLKARG